MGEVWKARDTRLDRVVAIKRLKGLADYNRAVEWALTAADEKNVEFLSNVIRPYQRLLRGAPRWPELLHKLNLV